MKKITYILLFFVLLSCNYFEKKKISVTDALIEKKQREIDFSQIDRYPIFKACEDLNADELVEKECFINTLSNHISDFLGQQNIVLTEAIQDTLNIRLQVNLKGELSVQDYQVSTTVLKAIPNIRTLISKSISNMQTIKPAYKKIPETETLIPVTTQFMIPIVISE